jgi:TDG/mug DNA glycosylase family protein
VGDLRAADYRAGAPELKQKLLECKPRVVWFHGMVPWKNYLKYAEGVEIEAPWGAQKLRIGTANVFVTPNPSPANAQFSVDDLIKFYNEMVSYRIREQFGLGIR